MAASDCGRDPDEAGLPADQVLRTFGRVAQAYDASRIMLVVTGGEPLVRPDLLDVLARARGLGFRLGLVTNGMAVDELTARRLAAIGLESVVVSLDGPEECHDWLRRRRGAFERASGAIRSLRRAGVPILEAITCVTPGSLR